MHHGYTHLGLSRSQLLGHLWSESHANMCTHMQMTCVVTCSYDLAEKTKDFVITVVGANDLVSR